MYPQPQGEKKRLVLIEAFETGRVHWRHKYSLTSASQYKFALYSIMFPYLWGKEIAFHHLFFQKDVICLFIVLCTFRSCHMFSGTNIGWEEPVSHISDYEQKMSTQPLPKLRPWANTLSTYRNFLDRKRQLGEPRGSLCKIME